MSYINFNLVYLDFFTVLTKNFHYRVRNRKKEMLKLAEKR